LNPFHIVLKGVTGSENEYLFLNVKVGNDQIIELHDRLYSGLLKQYLNRTVAYIPHLTVGRFKDKQSFKLAVTGTENFNETFETMIHEIVVERINPTGKSIIELKISL
jgi:2'-5' RNA ligase